MADNPNEQLQKVKTITTLTRVCQDFYTGAVKVLSNTYLPKWTGETEAGYKVRILSTSFANMYAPIVDGLTGLITKKEPTITGYENLNMDNVDMQNTGFTSFVKETTKQSLIDGLVFVTAETHIKQNKIYLKQYKYENLMSYVVEENVLTQIVFKDIVEEKDGKFGMKKLERYIVFKIGGGEVWYQKDNDGEITHQAEEDWTNTLGEIPIVAIQTGKTITQFEVVPKLYDTAILNKVHLSLESNLANVLGVVGNPIPVFYGQTQEKGLTIGVKDALVFADKSKEGFEYVEISGASVGKLQDKIKTVEEQIDKLTFSLLQKQNSKTVIDAQETQTKNTSFLTDVAVELEVKFNKLYQFVSELENKPLKADAKIEFKKDFDDILFSDSQLDMLYKMLQSGDLSRSTFWSKLKVANILPKEFDEDKENEEIGKDVGTGLGV